MFEIPTERGWFGGVTDSARMLVLRPVKSRISNLAVFYRAQQFGCVATYTCMETASGVQGLGLGDGTRSKFKSRVEWEEFISFHGLAELVYEHAVRHFDSEFRGARRERIHW